MTDKDKLSKVRAEIERRKDKAVERLELEEPQYRNIQRSIIQCYDNILSFIDSMQEEPVSIWHDASETPSIFGTYLLMHEDGWCVARYYGNITGWVEISQHIIIVKPKKWLDLREILPKTK